VNFFSSALIVVGLCLFETISSIDNAIINAEVLSGMGQKARRWFLCWGILFAVFVIRGILPWLIVWCTTPQLGPWGALTATFSGDSRALAAVEESSPILLIGGGIFLMLADTFARTAASPVEIPVGIITSLSGGPFFLYLLRKKRIV